MEYIVCDTLEDFLKKVTEQTCLHGSDAIKPVEDRETLQSGLRSPTLDWRLSIQTLRNSFQGPLRVRTEVLQYYTGKTPITCLTTTLPTDEICRLYGILLKVAKEKGEQLRAGKPPVNSN